MSYAYLIDRPTPFSHRRRHIPELLTASFGKKNSLGSQVMVSRLRCCLCLPKNGEVEYNQFAELVTSFIYGE